MTAETLPEDDHSLFFAILTCCDREDGRFGPATWRECDTFRMSYYTRTDGHQRSCVIVKAEFQLPDPSADVCEYVAELKRIHKEATDIALGREKCKNCGETKAKCEADREAMLSFPDPFDEMDSASEAIARRMEDALEREQRISERSDDELEHLRTCIDNERANCVAQIDRLTAIISERDAEIAELRAVTRTPKV